MDNNGLNIFVVAGKGGHFEQARRVTSELVDRGALVALYSDHSSSSGLRNVNRLKNISAYSKGSGVRARLQLLLGLASLFFYALRELRRSSPSLLVSTGPVICIPFVLAARWKGIRVVHIETWSRFKSRSKTGVVCYLLANHFFYQNRSLSELYPSGDYSGRL